MSTFGCAGRADGPGEECRLASVTECGPPFAKEIPESGLSVVVAVLLLRCVREDAVAQKLIGFEEGVQWPQPRNI